MSNAPSLAGTGHRRVITDLLDAWSAGDVSASSELLPLVYAELRKIAASLFRCRAEDSLQPTDVVHEACVRLIERSGGGWQDRAHFYGALARSMRQILVDHHRHKQRLKRGGKAVKLQIAEEILPAVERTPDLVRLDEALRTLESLAPDQAAVVELRYFGGLTIDEIAETLSISPKTVGRRWRRARAWLYDQMRRS